MDEVSSRNAFAFSEVEEAVDDKRGEEPHYRLRRGTFSSETHDYGASAWLDRPRGRRGKRKPKETVRSGETSKIN